ncbi:hypothetical protein L596_007668 [Steinernema carpocapsae]|uniref:C2H2-type domain-containing protein n=1 Tax=Steinernema carpocapsae TaxID=34508 RepID=A0A4U5PAN3_STECR|nr:hypothetical protein L596_007668 [Steinernema carpocapsae]
MNICCPFEGCSGKFSRTRKLSVHMERDHQFHCKRIDLTFTDREQFQRWLDDLNGRSNVSFVCWHGRKTSYVLQCSKSRKGKKKPVSEKKHTTKLDIICPAHISVCQRDDGYVTVSAQLSHYGHEVSDNATDVPEPEVGVVQLPPGAVNSAQEENLLEDEDEEEIFAEPDPGEDAEDSKITTFGLRELANVATALGFNGDYRSISSAVIEMGASAGECGNRLSEAQQPLNLAGTASQSSASVDLKREEATPHAEKLSLDQSPVPEPLPSTSAAILASSSAPTPTPAVTKEFVPAVLTAATAAEEQPESLSFQTEVRQNIAALVELVKIYDDIGPEEQYSQEDQEAILDKIEHATACLQDGAKKIARRPSVIVSDSSSTSENLSASALQQPSNRRKRRQPVALDLDP